METLNEWMSHILVRESKRAGESIMPFRMVHNLKLMNCGPGSIAQLVRASSSYTKVVGSISNQGTYKKQPMNA